MKRILFQRILRLFKKEIEEARAQSYRQGLWVGEQKRGNEVAKKLLAMGLDVDAVAEVSLLEKHIVDAIKANGNYLVGNNGVLQMKNNSDFPVENNGDLLVGNNDGLPVENNGEFPVEPEHN